MSDASERVDVDDQLEPGDVILEAQGLVAGYHGVPVVHDFNLKLRAGEIVALLGPNGSGKSTILLTLAGALPSIGGGVLWRGERAHASIHQRARRGLAVVPEGRAVLMSMTVRDNLLLGSGGVADAVADFPELELLLNRQAGLLSGGEQQMLTLARALASSPQALLIDELSLGLAPLVVERLFDKLVGAARRRGVALLLVEQQVRRALRVSDRWMLLRQGRIVREGDDQALDDLASAYLSGVSPS